MIGRGNSQLAAVGHCVPGIDREVQDYLFELIRIRLNQLEIGGQACAKLDVLADNRTEHLVHLPYDVFEIEDFEPQLLLATKSQQLASQSTRAFAGFLDLFQVGASGIVRWAALEQDIGEAKNRREQIVEIV